MSEWPPESPATPPFSPRRSPWTSCETRSFELRGAAMPSRERVRPIPPRRPCHSSHTARRNAHGHFLAHASRSGWPGQGDGGRELPINTDDGPHHEMGSHFLAIPPCVHRRRELVGGRAHLLPPLQLNEYIEYSMSRARRGLGSTRASAPWPRTRMLRSKPV